MAFEVSNTNSFASAEATPARASLPFNKKIQLDVKVDRGEALRYLGYSNQDVDPALMARFEAMATECENLSRPYCAWATFPIDQSRTRWLGNGEKDPVVVLDNGLELKGPSINQHLRGATHVVLYAGTLGLKNEMRYQQLNATDPTDALMFGACGSSLVECAADAAEERIRTEAAAAGLFCNWRYSPGYGDLPLETQPHVLRALDAQRSIGLNVTPTHLLVPTKSITAIMGLFETEPAFEPPSPCDDCLARIDCDYKKRGITCHGQ